MDGWVLGNAQLDLKDQNLRDGKLWPFLQAARLYHCPSDRSKVLGRPDLVRFGSYQIEMSLNLELVPGQGIPIPDKFGAGNLRKDFDAYAPADNFGFLDVSEASINEGGFGFQWDFGSLTSFMNGPPAWIHQPGERHGHGANLSFLDGHVGQHRWLFTPKHCVAVGEASPPANQLDRDDLGWLYDRTHLGQYRKRLLGLPLP